MYCCMVGAQIGPGQEKKKKQIGPSQIYAERVGWDKWTDGWMGQLGNSPETVTTTSATVVLKIRIR